MKLIIVIQAKCKFYNYEIWQKAIKNEKGKQGQIAGRTSGEIPITHHYEVNAEVFQVIEHNYGNVIGKQPSEQK